MAYKHVKFDVRLSHHIRNEMALKVYEQQRRSLSYSRGNRMQGRIYLGASGTEELKALTKFDDLLFSRQF